MILKNDSFINSHLLLSLLNRQQFLLTKYMTEKKKPQKNPKNQSQNKTKNLPHTEQANKQTKNNPKSCFINRDNNGKLDKA